MNKNVPVVVSVMCLIVGIAILSAAGYIIGYCEATDIIEKEAVRRGYAEYVLTPNVTVDGRYKKPVVEWRWKENTQPESEKQ